MNKYWAIALLVSFVAWSGFMYYEGGGKERALCSAADAKQDMAQAGVTIKAAKGVVATVGKQQDVTKGVDNAYQLKKSVIDNQYAGDDSLRAARAPASNYMPPAACAAGRPHAAATRSFRTKVFKLSPQECDENTEQLYGLQDWVKGQLAIKPAE